MNFYAGLRPIVGAKTVDVSLPDGATVQQLLDEILRCWPALRPYLLDDEGRLSSRVNLAVDGRSVLHLPDALSTRLTPKDEIAIFPAVAGGA